MPLACAERESKGGCRVSWWWRRKQDTESVFVIFSQFVKAVKMERLQVFKNGALWFSYLTLNGTRKLNKKKKEKEKLKVALMKLTSRRERI